MTAEQKSALRTLAGSLPPGTPIHVPSEWLLAALGEAEETPLVPSPEPRLLTPEEVASRLGVEVQWVYRRARSWSFARRLGRAIRIDPVGLEKWLARQSPDRQKA